jgi:hypothetical protein
LAEKKPKRKKRPFYVETFEDGGGDDRRGVSGKRVGSDPVFGWFDQQGPRKVEARGTAARHSYPGDDGGF